MLINPDLRAVMQHQPGAVLRFGDDHPAGVGVRLPEPADRHRGVHRRRRHRRAGGRQSAACRGGIGAGWRSARCSASVFMHWLIFQSLYRIGALCPYCMVVWAVTIPLLVVVASIALAPQLAGNGVARVALPVALVAGRAVVHRADSDDPGAVLELLVDADLTAPESALGYARDLQSPGRQPRRDRDPRVSRRLRDGHRHRRGVSRTRTATRCTG